MMVMLATTALLATPAAAAWRQREFVVGGLYTGDVFDLQRFLLFQRAGLNLVINGDRSDLVDAQRTALVLDSLRVARPGFDLKLIVSYRQGPDDARVAFNPQARKHRTGLVKTLGPSGGINRPSVEGWWIWDEPCTDGDLEAVGDLIALLDSLPATRDQLALLSLLPISASGQPAFDQIHGRNKSSAYRRYLDRVISMYIRRGVPVPLLSADLYPFQTDEMRSDYFLNLALLRDAALAASTAAHRVPFWLVVQLSPWRVEGNRYHESPSVAQVRWQVSTALAYGAKGILYWTLVPSGGVAEFGPGLLDGAGRPTARYESVRLFNLEVRRIGSLLLGLDPVAVRHQDTGRHEGIANERLGAAATPSSLVTGMTGGTGDGMVGHLRDPVGGADYLYVVNKGLRASADFRVELSEEVATIERIAAADAPPTTVARNVRGFSARSIAPGGGALFRVRRPAPKTSGG